MLLTYPTRFTEGIFFQMASEEFSFEQPEGAEEVEPALFAAKMLLRAC